MLSTRSAHRGAGLLALTCIAGFACRADLSVPVNPPDTAQLQTVPAEGHPMAVWVKPARGEQRATALLLHGRTWSTLPDFDLQVPGEHLSLMDDLTQRGIRTFGLDARGYGATPRDDSGWLTPDRAARDVIAVLEWMRQEDPGAPAPVLFGWSYGSMVAQLTAQRRPDLISGVVLYGYPNDPDTVRPPDPAPAEPARAATTATGAASDFIVEGAISDQARDAYVAAALAADPVRTDWKDQDQWNELSPPLVTVPTLLIEGEADPLTDTDAHVSLFTRLGNADKTWVVVAGGDHAVLLEKPRDAFVSAVGGFMTRVGGRARP